MFYTSSFKIFTKNYLNRKDFKLTDLLILCVKQARKEEKKI